MENNPNNAGAQTRKAGDTPPSVVSGGTTVNIPVDLKKNRPANH